MAVFQVIHFYLLTILSNTLRSRELLQHKIQICSCISERNSIWIKLNHGFMLDQLIQCLANFVYHKKSFSKITSGILTKINFKFCVFSHAKCQKATENGCLLALFRPKRTKFELFLVGSMEREMNKSELYF